jgi:glutamate-1-semialdehyde 2,1-aminomutase
MGKGQTLYKKAKQLIPGGTQLLSKRPELHLPGLWPSYYSRAKGCEVWDLDGNKFLDMSYMGIAACVLGYSDEDVNGAVKKAVDEGNVSTLNSPEEVELAETLIKLHPWAEQARFARSGGEAMAVAVRIGRAATNKDKLLFCGYHGWHDWYLSANLADDKSLDGHLLPGLEPAGVPRALKGSAIPFYYNQTEQFLELIEKHGKEVGIVVMEPARNYNPDSGFLETVRKVTKRLGIVLIFDEISSGFRIYPGGAHMEYNIYPDIAVFSKAMGNGYPVAAIIGKKKYMKAAEKTFISSTTWTDRTGSAAALATIKKFRKEKVEKVLQSNGKKMQEGWKSYADKYGVKITLAGLYPLSSFSFDYKNATAIKTLFTQLMLDNGILGTTAYDASFAHKDEHFQKYFKALDTILEFIARAIQEKKIEKHLKGPISHNGFKRLA